MCILLFGNVFKMFTRSLWKVYFSFWVLSSVGACTLNHRALIVNTEIRGFISLNSFMAGSRLLWTAKPDPNCRWLLHFPYKIIVLLVFLEAALFHLISCNANNLNLYLSISRTMQFIAPVLKNICTFHVPRCKAIFQFLILLFWAPLIQGILIISFWKMFLIG